MKTVISAALAWVVLLFALPLLWVAAWAPPPAQATKAILSPAPAAVPRDRPTPGGIDSSRTLRVLLDDGSAATLPLNVYLQRVVAAEMPAAFEPEALKAQTVAARTYALRKLGSGSSAHPEADLCTDITCCQAYLDEVEAAARWGAGAATYQSKISAAVADTDGLVITYRGALIDAVFHSSSAGVTLDASEVWSGDLPYLVSVPSPEGEEVPNYHTTVTLPLNEVKEIVSAAHPALDLSGDPALWLAALPAAQVRALFSLRSARFTAALEGDSVVFSVTGYGHGVGMSQYGANALAKQGKTCNEILQWYYTGASVVPLTAVVQ